MARKAPAPYHIPEGCRGRVNTYIKRGGPARWKIAELRKWFEDAKAITEGEEDPYSGEEVVADAHGFRAVGAVSPGRKGARACTPVTPTPRAIADPL